MHDKQQGFGFQKPEWYLAAAFSNANLHREAVEERLTKRQDVIALLQKRIPHPQWSQR